MSEDAMANRGGIQDAKNLEARMSGKTAADYARELLEVTDEWAPAGDIDPSKLTAALAAAEERGRRCGVEERDELRAALIASRPFVADHYKQHALGINAKYHLDLLNRIDAALAPRDSGKVKPESDADFIGRIEKGFRK